MNIFSEPTTFRLKGFPRKTDQGERSTCAAFSAVAMLEYYLDFKESLSPQHLYALCQKENQKHGVSDFAEIFKLIEDNGVCRYSEWPYNRNSGGSEGQAYSQEMLSSLKGIHFDDVQFQMFKTDPPRGIDEYKSVLSGADGHRPSPVLVGCQIFSSTFTEPGWAKLPVFPMEENDGYHAMLIYGWKDTPGLDSKGFFYVQNSWGGSNDLKIPFEYIESYAYSAARFVAAARAVEPESEPEKSCDPVKTESVEMTEQKDDPKLPANVTAIKNNYFTSQNTNMKDGKYSYPGIRLPFPQKIGAFWNVDKNCFDKPENCRNPYGFNNYLEQEGIQHLFSEVKIYRIQIKKSSYYHVVSAFLHRYDGTSVDMNDVELLLNYYNDVYAKSCGNRARYTIFTVGTSGRFAPECVTSCDPAIFLCEPGEKGAWLFHLPKAVCGWITQEFFSHMLPGSFATVLQKKMENWDQSQNINMASLKAALGADSERDLYDRTIESALDTLFSSGKYAKNKKGNIIPPNWTIPAGRGYRVCGRFSSPTKRQYSSLIIWGIVTAILLGFQIYTSKQFGIPLPFQSLSLLLVILWTVIRFCRDKALRSFRYGGKN